MAPNLRVAAAFRAMRQIGIIEEKVKPVLKSLLKLYEKNWQLIEAENYRALADAIFENEESQAVEEGNKRKERADVLDMKEKEVVIEDPEPPSKRLRSNQKVQALPSVGNPSSKPNGTLLKQPKEEVIELPEATQNGYCSPKLIKASELNSEDNEEAHAMSCPPLVRRKGKQPMIADPSLDVADKTLALAPNGTERPMSPATCQREKGKEPVSSQSRPNSDRSNHGVRFKEGKAKLGNSLLPKQQANNSGALIKPKDEPATDDVQQLVVPLAAIHPGGGSQSDGALDVTDKATNHANESCDSENVHEVAQTLVPMHAPSLNGNNCSTTLKDTDKCTLEIDKEKESQQHQPTPNVVKPFYDVADLANGQERIAISLVNEVNDERPSSFHYIPRNVVFQNAYVNFSLARIGENCCSTCSGDCLSAPIPCACAHESGGEYAYTSEGLVKEDILKESVSMNRDPENHCQFYCSDCPLERSKEGVVEKCQGHLMRRFIKECWWKCGCDNQCGNRVVQRGINRKLQVFMTPEGKGWGLRTLEDLPEGAFVCEYVGEILTNAELFERVSQRRASGEVHAYPVLLDADWGAEGVLKDEEALCLDATNYGNVGRFINHRCVDSNMVEIPVEVETPDHHYYHLAFFTTREVKALEELTWDYGIDFDLKGHPVKAFKCKCGSKLCRNMKRPNRSKSRSRRRR